MSNDKEAVTHEQEIRLPHDDWSYHCEAWGETDRPVVSVVRDLAGIRQFFAVNWFGEDDCDELDEVMEELKAHDFSEDGTWEQTFEIGGVEVRRVYFEQQKGQKEIAPDFDAWLKKQDTFKIPLCAWGESHTKIAHLFAQDYLRLHRLDDAAQQQKEVGWLIENGKSGAELRYRTWDEHGAGPEWTADHTQATRYCRRVDAERAAAGDEDAWAIVEHTWSKP